MGCGFECSLSVSLEFHGLLMNRSDISRYIAGAYVCAQHKKEGMGNYFQESPALWELVGRCANSYGWGVDGLNLEFKPSIPLLESDVLLDLVLDEEEREGKGVNAVAIGVGVGVGASIILIGGIVAIAMLSKRRKCARDACGESASSSVHINIITDEYKRLAPKNNEKGVQKRNEKMVPGWSCRLFLCDLRQGERSGVLWLPSFFGECYHVMNISGWHGKI
eukprot:1159779-Pelagomonas_calceolata.AAC.7